ncbi:MAG: hypothetical protein ACK58T_46920, partial [Phycisphaerae bacterium]
ISDFGCQSLATRPDANFPSEARASDGDLGSEYSLSSEGSFLTIEFAVVELPEPVFDSFETESDSPCGPAGTLPDCATPDDCVADGAAPGFAPPGCAVPDGARGGCWLPPRTDPDAEKRSRRFSLLSADSASCELPEVPEL